MIRRSLPLVLSAATFALCGYVLNVYLARLFGPTDYGDVGLTLSVMSLATVILTSGVPLVVSREVAALPKPDPAPLLAGTRAQAVVVGVLVVVLIALSPFVSGLYRGGGNWQLVALAAATLPGYAAMTVLAGHWNGLHRFWRQCWLVSAYSVGKLIAVVPLALWLGPVGALLGYAIAPLAGIVVGRVARTPVAGRTWSVGSLLRQSLPLSLLALLTLAMYSVDLFLVAALTNEPTATSFYVVAQSIALIPLTAFSAVGQVSTPTVARLIAAGNSAAAGRTVAVGLRNQVLLLAPVVVLLVLGAEHIVTLLYGSRFAGASTTVEVLVPAYALLSLLVSLSGCLTGAGAGTKAARSALVGLLATTAVGAALTPAMGANGAALGLGVGATIAATIALRALNVVIPLRREPEQRH